jgi:DNA mismatch repair ATPase MutS
MKQEIVNAIAAYLEQETKVTGFRNNRHRIEFGGTLNRAHFTHAGFCQEIAAEIADEIEPLLPKENESGNHPDSKYTAHFLEWRSKYFEKKEVTTHFQSNHTGGKFSYEDLELKYAKAMCESPLK